MRVDNKLMDFAIFKRSEGFFTRGSQYFPEGL